jgi:hypothetical protein
MIACCYCFFDWLKNIELEQSVLINIFSAIIVSLLLYLLQQFRYLYYIKSKIHNQTYEVFLQKI